jgi:hypothetical protein
MKFGVAKEFYRTNLNMVKMSGGEEELRQP